MYNLLLLNWYLLGVEMNLGHAHKTRFWYLLGVFSDEHPRHFYRGVSPGKIYPFFGRAHIEPSKTSVKRTTSAHLILVNGSSGVD